MHRSNKEHTNTSNIRAYIRGDSREYTPHGANTFTLMKHKHKDTCMNGAITIVIM